MCAEAGTGSGLVTRGQDARRAIYPPHPGPHPPRAGLENTKAGPTRDIVCKRRRGRSFCRVSATAGPTTGAEVSARRGALEKGLFSIQGGWAAVVTKLGEGGGFKEERSLKGRSGRGGVSPSLRQESGQASLKAAGTYGKLVGKRLRGWLSLVGSGDR